MHTATEQIASSSYRFVKPPIVVYRSYQPDPQNTFYFYVFVRVNKALPRNKTHGVRPIMRINGTTADGKTTTSSKRPPCYMATFSSGNGPHEAPEITHPRDGELVTVTLTLRRRELANARVHARHVPRDQIEGSANRRYLRRLGCLS